MPLRRAALLLVLAAACRPSVRGRCTSDTDCRAGSACTPDGLCVNAPRPTVQVVLQPGTTLAPSAPRVLVRVAASGQIALGRLSVTVSSTRALASGALASASAGDNTVTLTHFEPDAVGQVSVAATLQFMAPGGAADSVTSDLAGAAIDTGPPAVNVFIPAAADMVNGWVPRTSGTLEVQAQVDDGGGSGPASATLTLDRCPSAVQCSYPGAVVARPSAGAATFSFLVPRAAQEAGSEAPVTGVVLALDQAQNVTRKPVTLQIDDDPPALGPVTLVSTGVKGEDGNSWFAGGASALPVEISVAASDHGAGLLDLVLHLDPADVAPGTADPAPSANADGTLHFRLPAAAVVGREGPLRFSLTARDALLNKAVLPESPSTSVWIDDVPPVVTPASVTYGSTLPAQIDVCSSDPNVICGRVSSAGGAADHLLRDDVATVTFDAYDCGAGLAASGGAGVNGLDATLSTSSGAPCANSANPVHHYTLQLDVSTQTPGAPDLNGSEKLALASDALDLLAHRTDNRAGAALVSIVRWRSQLPGGAPPSGAPALLPGSSPRQVVVGTAATTGNNLFLLDPQGGLQMSTAGRISSDVAVDKNGVIYAAGVIPGTGGASDSSTLSIYDSTTPMTPPSTCTMANAVLGAPVLTGPDLTIAVLASSSSSGLNNVFAYQKSCAALDQELITLDGQTTFTGVTGEGSTVFFGHGAGFTSSVFSRGAFDQLNAVSYSSNGGNSQARGGPSIAGTSPNENPLFAGSDKKVHKAVYNGACSNAPCWQPGFSTAAAANNLSSGTPVFDSNAIYVTDSSGIVYAFRPGSAASAPLGQVAPLGSASIPVSAPVLVGSSQALVVQGDATLRLLSPLASTGVPLLQMTKVPAGGPASYPAGAAPPTPVVDVHGTGGVAYVPDGNGWVWAVQLDQPPVAASATAWPRPGRDTCNSRNASASYCP